MSSLASSLSPRTNNCSFRHENSNSLPGATYGVLDIKRELFCGCIEVGCVICFVLTGKNVPCTSIGQLGLYFGLFWTRLQNCSDLRKAKCLGSYRVLPNTLSKIQKRFDLPVFFSSTLSF